MTTKKKYCAVVLVSLVLGVGPMTASAWSAQAAVGTEVNTELTDGTVVDPVTPDIDSETPAFSNPAQAQHAANVAQQAATENTAVQEALQDVETAQDALDQAVQTNDPQAMEAARAALTAAEEGYMESLAEVTGVIEDDIASMRDSGMGWGEISRELGVHPGMLGLGHTKGKQNHYAGAAAEPGMGGIDPEELSEATARNMESGWSKGHGVGVQAGIHDSGTGFSEGRSRGRQGREAGNDHSSGGMAGAGGLGHGGGSESSMSSGSASGNHGGGSSGGAAGNGGSGHTGGSSNGSGHGAAGTDGSPGNSGNGGNSGGHGGSGNSGSGGSQGGSGGHGGAGNSGSGGSQGGSGGHGGAGNSGSGGHGSGGASGGHGNSGGSEGGGGGRW